MLKPLLILLLPLSLFAQRNEPMDIIEVGSGNSYFVQKVGDDRESGLVRVELEKGTQSELASARPSRLRKFVGQRLSIIGNVSQRFPVESAAFFVAIGALNYWETMNNFSKNPLAQSQHFEALSDPVAHAGFAAFMWVNGEVSHVVGASIKNPTFQKHFLPYVGMSAGLMASNIVHEVFHDTQLMQCWRLSKTDATDVASLDKKLDRQIKIDEACDAAYDNWVSHFHEKAYTWAPSLASLMASTFLSGKIHQGWKSLVGKFLKARGVDVLLMVGPQGPWLHFGKQIINFTIFTYLDWVINPLVRIPFNNLLQSKDFKEISDKLFKGILHSKQNSWQPMYLDKSCTEKSRRDNEALCRYQLTEDLKEFKRMKKRWRDMNVEEIMTAHNSWADMVNTVTGQVAFAAKTYTEFLNNALKPEMQPNLLFQDLPLWGVSPGKHVEGKDKELLLVTTKDYMFTDLQLAHLRETVNNFQVNLSHLKKSDREIVEKILKNLSALEVSEIAQGLRLLNEALGVGKTTKPAGLLTDTEILLRNLRNELGNPWPSKSFGEAFSNFNDFTQKVSQNSALQNWQLPTGILPANSPTQKMLATMICGPEVAEIKNRVGFKPSFHPPRLTEHANLNVCAHGAGSRVSIPFFKFQIDGTTTPVAYLLRNLDLLHYDSRGTKKNWDKIDRNFVKNRGPIKWWDTHVDTVLLNWFEKQKPVYEENIVKLLEAFQRPKDHAFNKNEFVANNLGESLAQEFKVYALILGELLKDEANLKRDPKIYNALFLQNETPEKVTPVAMEGGAMAHHLGVPFLKMIRQNSNLNFNDLLSMYSKHPSVPVQNLTKKFPANYAQLKIHHDLMNSFARIERLFSKIQISTEQLPVGYFDYKRKTRKTIVGTVRNSEFEAELQNITSQLESIVKNFSPYFDTVFANQVLVQTVSGMQDVVSTYVEYGEIINLMNITLQRKDDEQDKKSAQQIFKDLEAKRKCTVTTGNKANKRSDDGCKE